MGTPVHDLMTVGQLLGEKTILNEFYAYVTFGKLKEAGVIEDPKSIVIEKPIEELGIFEVGVKIHPKVTAKVRLWVASSLLCSR